MSKVFRRIELWTPIYVETGFINDVAVFYFKINIIFHIIKH